MTKSIQLLAALLLTLAYSQAAAAQDAPSEAATDGARGVLRLSKLYSFGGGTDLQHGFGLDLRYHAYPESGMDGYVGVFGQGQYELGDAWRAAAGVSFGWDFFGLELGVSHRTETAGLAGSTGLHIGQAFTYGPLSIGARVTIPLYDHIDQTRTMSVQGIEGALTIRLGFGFQVQGERRAHGCHSGHGDAGGSGHPHGGGDGL